MHIEAPTKPWSIAACTLLLGLSYYLLARASLLLAIPPGYSTAIWPAAGLALAAVLLMGNRVAGGVFLGSLAANITVGQPDAQWQEVQWLVPSMIAVGSTLQAMISRVVVSRFCGNTWDFLNTRQSLMLILWGGAVGCLISSLNGNLVLMGAGLIQPQSFFFSWVNWWIGDSLGVFVIAPLVLMWAQPESVIDSRRKLTVTAPMLALFVCVTLLYSLTRSDLQSELKQRLDNETTNILVILKNQIQANQQIVQSLKSFYLSSDQVTRREFDSFSSHLGKGIDSLQATEWAPRIKHADLKAFADTHRDDGPIEFKELHEGRVQALSPRAYYQPVIFSWPKNEANQNVVGLDLLSDLDRKASIEQALNSGGLVVSGPLNLVQGKKGYLLMEAIDPKVSEDVLLTVIDFERFFAKLDPLLVDRPLQIEVVDDDGNVPIFGFSDNRRHSDGIHFENNAGLVEPMRRDLKFGQKTLVFSAGLSTAYITKEMNNRIWPVLTAGFSIVGCLSLLVIATTGNQTASIRLVNEKTKELENERIFLDTLLDNLPIILYVKDAATRKYLRFNRAATTYFQRSPRDLIGQTRHKVFSHNMTEPAKDSDDVVVDEGRIVREKTTFHYQDKDYWFDSQKIPIKSNDGQVQYILGLAEDITVETNTRRELQESKEYLSMVLNSVGEGIYGIDTQGRCTFVNDAACKMLGYRDTDWLGKQIHDIVHHKYKDGRPYPVEKCPIMAVFKDRELHQVAHEVFWHKDGSALPVEYMSTPIEDRGEVVGAVVVFSDISKRKAVDRLQKEHTQRLEQINQELEEFSYVASHDIQEPLRTLNCFCEFLVEDIGRDLPEKARIDIDYITEASQRMNLLINDMLEYSRAGRTTLEMTNVPLQRCIENIKNDLMVLIRESHAKVEVSSGLPLLLGDEAQLTRIFQNLIHNAIKFRDPDREPVVKISQLPDNEEEYVWVTVTDNGIGIERRFHEQIFGAFRRLHQNDQYGGSGIGLAVVKKLIERHGGTVRIESELGVGTTFYIKLKKYPTESVMAEIAPPRYSSSHSSSS